jgi:hypothetical protein
MRSSVLLSLLVALSACGGAPDRAAPPTPVSAPTPAPAAAPPPAPAASGVPDPLAGATPAAICADDVLLTVKHPIEDLASGGFHRICCESGVLTGDEAWRCEMDWPFNDVPTCDAWDTWRNGIFARYGYPFSDPRWRAAFEGQPGYTRREDFDPAWLPEVATDNVETLKRWKAERHLCAG